MIKRVLFRSGIQLLGLCVLSLFLTKSTHAMEENCVNQMKACASHCGTTTTYAYQYTWWNPAHDWGMVYHPDTDEWYDDYIGGYEDRYEWQVGSGVESWECQPDLYTGRGICMCAD